jgi:heptosyltransferase-2
MSNILLASGYGLGNQILNTPLVGALHSLGHNIIVISEHIGVETLTGHPLISAVIPWYPGNDNYDNQIIQYIDQKVKPEIGIACIPVHGTAPDKFLERCGGVMNYGKIENWSRHEADLSLDYARELGWHGDWIRSEIFIPDDIEAEVGEDVAKLDKARPIVGFHYGCINSWTWIYKKWHLERFIEVAERLHNETGCYIYLGGGPSERDEGDQFKLSLPEHIQEYVIDTVGKLSLKHSAAWMRACNLFISNDSGPMHMAAALEVPLVAIFGMSSEIKNGPWVDPTKDLADVITAPLWCRPCYGTDRHKMCERGDCLSEISVDMVYNQALDRLGAKDKGI